MWDHMLDFRTSKYSVIVSFLTMGYYAVCFIGVASSVRLFMFALMIFAWTTLSSFYFLIIPIFRDNSCKWMLKLKRNKTRKQKQKRANARVPMGQKLCWSSSLASFSSPYINNVFYSCTLVYVCFKSSQLTVSFIITWLGMSHTHPY